MEHALAPDVVLAWSRLVRAEQTLLARVEDDLKRACFPPLTWYDVLLELDREPEGRLPQSAVQTRVLMAQYNLCRLADRLEREGLLRRFQCPHDGRSNVLEITDKGRELRARMWPAYADAIARHMGSQLTEADAASLARILAKLIGEPRARGGADATGA